MDFNLHLPINVISGKNAVSLNSHLLRRFGDTCLIVTGGKSSRLCGALGDMEAALKKEGIRYDVYDKIGPNPRLDHCFEASVKAREIGADFIIGIGGGSPLDAAKAVAVYSSNPGMSMEEIYTVTEIGRAHV